MCVRVRGGVKQTAVESRISVNGDRGGGVASIGGGERLRRTIVDSSATLPHRARPRIRSIAPRCHETSERWAPGPHSLHPSSSQHNKRNNIILHTTYIYISHTRTYNNMIYTSCGTTNRPRAHIRRLYTMPSTVGHTYNPHTKHRNSTKCIRFFL